MTKAILIPLHPSQVLDPTVQTAMDVWNDIEERKSGRRPYRFVVKEDAPIWRKDAVPESNTLMNKDDSN